MRRKNPMPEHRRAERVNRAILESLGDVLTREVHDPRLCGITLTGVDTTEDLQLARVFYTTREADIERRKEIETGLKSALGFLQSAVAQSLSLKRSPKLEFRLDSAFDTGARIERLLQEIHAEDAHGRDPEES